MNVTNVNMKLHCRIGWLVGWLFTLGSRHVLLPSRAYPLSVRIGTHREVDNAPQQELGKYFSLKSAPLYPLISYHK